MILGHPGGLNVITGALKTEANMGKWRSRDRHRHVLRSGENLRTQEADFANGGRSHKFRNSSRIRKKQGCQSKADVKLLASGKVRE